MIKNILTSLVILLSFNCFGQDNHSLRANPADTSYNPNEDIYTVVENQPEFVGGIEAMYQFIADNIVYPEKAREIGIQGTVWLTFVIEKSGRINDIKILRGIGFGCDEEALRVVKMMPHWKAGMQRGKLKRVQGNVPVRFSLLQEKDKDKDKVKEGKKEKREKNKPSKNRKAKNKDPMPSASENYQPT